MTQETKNHKFFNLNCLHPNEHIFPLFCSEDRFIINELKKIITDPKLPFNKYTNDRENMVIELVKNRLENNYIILLQEVWPSLLVKIKQLQFDFRSTTTPDMLMFNDKSQTKPLEHRVTILPKGITFVSSKEIELATLKGYVKKGIYAVIKSNNDLFGLMNVHLPYKEMNSESATRTLERLFGLSKNMVSPLIIIGDFNIDNSKILTSCDINCITTEKKDVIHAVAIGKTIKSMFTISNNLIPLMSYDEKFKVSTWKERMDKIPTEIKDDPEKFILEKQKINSEIDTEMKKNIPEYMDYLYKSTSPSDHHILECSISWN